MNVGDVLLQLGVGGIFAVLVLKLVFDFLRDKKPAAKVNVSVDGVTDRLDRIIDRLDELMTIAKLTRKQAELNGEQTEHQQRVFRNALGRIENAVQRQKPGSIESTT